MNKKKHSGGRPRKEIDVIQVKRLRDEGCSFREIARILKCGYGTVHRAAENPICEALDPKLSNPIQNTQREV